MSVRHTRRTMDVREIMEVLPHRPPFLLVDRILDITPGAVCVGVKNVTMNEEFFNGHFPGHPVMPAVLITEAMAQVGGILLLTLSGNQGKLAYFAGIDRQKFRKPVGPGDTLITRADIIANKGRIGKVRVASYVFRLDASHLDNPGEDGAGSSLPQNSVSILSDPGEQGPGRQVVFAGMVGELAAEGELMFALVDREGPATRVV